MFLEDLADIFHRSLQHGLPAPDRSDRRRACGLRRRHRSRLDPQRTVRKTVGGDASSRRQNQFAAGRDKRPKRDLGHRPFLKMLPHDPLRTVMQVDRIK